MFQYYTHLSNMHLDNNLWICIVGFVCPENCILYCIAQSQRTTIQVYYSAICTKDVDDDNDEICEKNVQHLTTMSLPVFGTCVYFVPRMAVYIFYMIIIFFFFFSWLWCACAESWDVAVVARTTLPLVLLIWCAMLCYAINLNSTC